MAEYRTTTLALPLLGRDRTVCWGMGPRRRAVAAHVLFALVVFALIFSAQSRWIFTHFSNDAYFLDSGWLAYLFGSADPLLHNPAGVNDLKPHSSPTTSAPTRSSPPTPSTGARVNTSY